MKEKYINKITISLGIVFIIIGILQNDYHDALMKAIFVCLECIGIG
ncbi:CD1871A family CXXC motif-containing protein [Miniphocaeibacter massiliensis]|nr:CD1871A family CXXC motif-containing protein [Miniphocaeibacter massiliensis]